MTAGPWVGCGDKNGGDQAAVDAMRKLVGSVSMPGISGCILDRPRHGELVRQACGELLRGVTCHPGGKYATVDLDPLPQP